MKEIKAYGGTLMLTLLHVVSNALMIAGFYIMASGWKRVHGANGGLVTDGLYAFVRHPQYSGLFLVTLGLLVPAVNFVRASPRLSAGGPDLIF